MNELKLIAVGSSALIAEEIKSEIASLIGEEIPIDTMTTDEVTRAQSNAFYICALTQECVLEKIIPRGKLFVLDLHPTTKFFLDIATIPSGERVCVFNNRLPYTQLLIKECLQLGIDQLQFEPVAYDEMPEREIGERLQAAQYIIGVACLMDERMLFSERFKHSLRADVKTIAGRRTASIKSAGRLLAGIAEFYSDRSSENVAHIVQLLRQASNNAIVNRIGLSSMPVDDSACGSNDAESQRQVLLYLHEKFRKLAELN